MQQTGTLRKRKKRNLAKVNGLTTATYNELDDNFDGRTLFSDLKNRPITSKTDNDTRIRMSSRPFTNNRSIFHSDNGLEQRVTRNPSFHADPEEGWDDDGGGRSGDKASNPTLSETRWKYIKERPNFLDKTAMNRLRQLLILGAASGTFPFKWNNKERRIDKWSPILEKLWNVQYFFVTIQTFCIALFQFYSFFARTGQESGKNKSYREVFMSTFSVYWYICCVCFNISMYIYKDEMRQYINTMLKFNQENVEKFLLHTEGLKNGGRLLINLSIPTNCSQVLASVVLFLMMPFQPWYLFSYIYPKPWYWLIPGAIQDFIMAGQVITIYMFTSWIVVAHTNTVQFWLRESHNNNDSDYTSDDLRKPRTAIETFRSLQILCTLFNDCMSPLAIPLIKLCSMCGIIPSGYVLIRSMNKIFIEEFPGILTYPLGVVDCASAGFVILSIAAEMFDLAVGFVDSWSRTRHKDFRRILMSLPTLKVKVGRCYFITVSTTITFFKTTFDFIIDCIMTFP